MPVLLNVAKIDDHFDTEGSCSLHKEKITAMMSVSLIELFPLLGVFLGLLKRITMLVERYQLAM
jgi:hypothetical protein